MGRSKEIQPPGAAETESTQEGQSGTGNPAEHMESAEADSPSEAPDATAQPSTQASQIDKQAQRADQRRTAAAMIAVILAGIAATLMIRYLPVLGIESALNPNNPDFIKDSNGFITNADEIALDLVKNSSVGWLLGFGGVFGLIAAIHGATDTFKGRAGFALTKLTAVISATFVAAAGLIVLIPSLGPASTQCVEGPSSTAGVSLSYANHAFTGSSRCAGPVLHDHVLCEPSAECSERPWWPLSQVSPG